MHQKFKGTGVALVTPFLADNSIDFESYKKIINYQIDGGIEYLLVLGSTGEAITISEEEQKELIAFAVKVINGRVPIMLGLSSNDTNALVKRIKRTDFTGIDSVLSACPAYNKPSQQGIFEHFKAIANVCPTPIFAYNVPSRTGKNIEVETTIKMAREIPSIVGIKEASGDAEQIMKIIKQKPAGFLVLSGDDNMAMPFIALGCDGLISVLANAFPKETSDMVRFALHNEFVKARELHYRLQNMIELIFAEGNPSGIKAVLNLKALCGKNPRLPLVAASDKLMMQIEQEILEINK
jgi:4-hydroxy-tetrahydrodipicolinate synthase